MDPISWKVLMSLNFSVSITNIASWALVRAMLSDLMFNFSYNTTPPPSGEKWYYNITDIYLQANNFMHLMAGRIHDLSPNFNFSLRPLYKNNNNDVLLYTQN